MDKDSEHITPQTENAVRKEPESKEAVAAPPAQGCMPNDAAAIHVVTAVEGEKSMPSADNTSNKPSEENADVQMTEVAQEKPTDAQGSLEPQKPPIASSTTNGQPAVTVKANKSVPVKPPPKKNLAGNKAKAILEERYYLADDFEPGPTDVICAWGKAAKQHPGYQRYRDIVRQNLARYDATKTKLERTMIVTEIVEFIRDSSPHGGFVKQDKETGRWYEVGDHLAREKVGQALRDLLHNKYSSSTQAKKDRNRKRAGKEKQPHQLDPREAHLARGMHMQNPRGGLPPHNQAEYFQMATGLSLPGDRAQLGHMALLPPGVGHPGDLPGLSSLGHGYGHPVLPPMQRPPVLHPPRRGSMTGSEVDQSERGKGASDKASEGKGNKLGFLADIAGKVSDDGSVKAPAQGGLDGSTSSRLGDSIHSKRNSLPGRGGDGLDATGGSLPGYDNTIEKRIEELARTRQVQLQALAGTNTELEGILRARAMHFTGAPGAGLAQVPLGAGALPGQAHGRHLSAPLEALLSHLPEKFRRNSGLTKSQT